ncbi:MAG: hypothetical protein ACI4WS_12590 [Oscillospiraceae bacterium]
MTKNTQAAKPNNEANNGFFIRTGRKLKEFFRKMLVSLKRSPQMIAMIALGVAFLVYSLNLSSISNTTAKINTANMGQCEFAGMLFSILAFVCILRAFPKRQKASKPMLVVYFLMMGILVFTDAVYYTRINEALTRTENPIVVDSTNSYITVAQNTVMVHSILIAVCVLLVATLPLYSKLLKKINTSIEVEGNGEMEAIDISGEDQ